LKAIIRLEDHYRKVAATPVFIPLNDRNYPYKASYKDEMGRQINLTYKSRVAEGLIFTAEPDADDLGLLFVKFTRKYSDKVHRFLARLGYAPQHRASVALPGGWKMVVMDFSDYSPLRGVALPLQLRHVVKTKVLDIVRTLHNNGFVHGDIRDANILLDRDTLSPDGCSVHLIDFDWAGNIGEVTYPMRINTKTITRPEGVSDGAPITPDHDIEMVNML
jgi:hypothetical protein